jgi:RNA polymerase sigma factor (sigma-70 family)
MAWLEPETARRLLQRCQNGDTRAWEQIVKGHADLVYSTARRAGLNAEDAEDVFQTTFLALHKNLDRIEDGSRIGKWLVVTASRESIRVSRFHGRTTQFGENNELLDELIQSDELSAEALVIQSMQQETAFSALQELEDKCRNLLIAIFSEETVPYEEISANLGLAIGSIGPTRARCIESLRKILDKKRFFDEPRVSKRKRKGSRKQPNV